MTKRRKSIGRSVFDTLWQQPLWAIPFAVFFGLLSGGGGRSFVRAYQVSLVFAYVIRIALVAYEQTLHRRVQARIRDGRLSPWTESLGYSSVSVLASYVAAGIVHFTLMPGFLGSVRMFVISGMFAVLFTSLIGGFFMARHFYRTAVERARAVEQARAELAQAELRALRAQVHPHFLFNTLNTIASLISENPAAAEDTTTRLADVFRYTLQASEREHTRLGDELAFLRAYLAIERTRFGDRLRVEESIEPGVEGALVPSLLLQPIVENAVRYAVAPREAGGRVALAARRDGDQLVIEVHDDGPGLDAASNVSGTGFGLHSVRERLRAAGLPQALAIDSSPEHGTRIRITLPLTFSPNASPTLPKGDLS